MKGTTTIVTGRADQVEVGDVIRAPLGPGRFGPGRWVKVTHINESYAPGSILLGHEFIGHGIRAAFSNEEILEVQVNV